MKKHLIAVAVAAAVSAPVMAQNVTISGTVDVTGWSAGTASTGAAGAAAGQSAKFKSTTNAGLGNGNGGWSTSVLNFAGSEDLGGGLKASFFVNQSINANTGALGGRDRWLALDGAFGQLKAGRFQTAVEQGYGAFAVTGTTNSAGTSDSTGFDLVAGTLGATQGRDALLGVSAGNAAAAAASAALVTAHSDMTRQPGVLQFTTPKFSNISLTIEYIQNSVDRDGTLNDSDDTVKQTGMRADYSAGPLAISAAHGKRKVRAEEQAAAAAGPLDEHQAKVTWLGASYDLGVAKLFYAYGSREDKSTGNVLTTANAITSDVTVHNLGIQVPVGSVLLNASLYDGADKRGVGDADDRTLTGYQLGARYTLSKRTFAYLVHGENKNKDDTPGNAVGDLSKIKQTGVGIVHTF
jgi:predicted porin